MTRSSILLKSIALVVATLCALPHSFAADIVWDGTAADGFWTNGPQTDPNVPFPENLGVGANWTIDAGPAGQIVTPDGTGPGVNAINYTYSDHDWVINGATISEDVQVQLSGGSLAITNSNVSLLPSSVNTGANLSALNLGQFTATSATFTNSTLSFQRANTSGDALRLFNGSSLNVVGSTINVAADDPNSEGRTGDLQITDPNSSMTIDATSVVNITGNLDVFGANNSLTINGGTINAALDMVVGGGATDAQITLNGGTLNLSGTGSQLDLLDNSQRFTMTDGVLNARFITLNAGGGGTDLMFDFQDGDITLGGTNPLRGNSFEGQLNWTGTPDPSYTITHTNFGGSNNQELPGKTASGFFSIDGTRINPTTANNLDWGDPANIATLNSELESLVVNSKFFRLTNTGSEHILELVASSVIQWTEDADDNWNDPNNWSTLAVPGVSDDVLFSDATFTAPRTVDVDTNVVVNKVIVSGNNQITFDDLTSGSMDVNEFEITGGTHEVAAPLAGGNTKKSGAGTLLLTADNSGFSGDIDVEAGTLQITNENQLGTGAVNIDGTLRLEDGYDGTYSKNLTGSGTFIYDPLQTSDPNQIESLDFTGNNSAFTGQITVREGRLTVNSTNDLGDSTGITRVEGSTGVVELNGSLNYGESFSIASRGGDNFPGADVLAHLRNQTGNNTISGSVVTTGSSFHNVEVVSGTSLTFNNTAGSPAVIDNPNGTLRFKGDGNTTIGNTATPGSGQLIGEGSVLKQGTGTLTVATGSSDTNDFSTGEWTVEAGTLEVLTGGGDAGELAARQINVQAGAVFDIDDFGTYNIQIVSDPDDTFSTGDEIGQRFTGSGTIIAQNFRGLEHLRIAPGDSVGTLNIQGNFTMVTGTPTPAGRLSYELGDATTVGGAENDLIDVTGNLTLSPTAGGNRLAVDVVPVEGTLAPGSYRLINYGGSLSGSGTGTNFLVNIVDSDDPDTAVAYGATRQTFAVSTGTANQVNLVVTGTEATQTWTGTDGTDPNLWDVDTSDNWSGTGSRYFDLDNVVFGDGPTVRDVVVADGGDVFPGSVTFNNSAGNDYTINSFADPNGVSSNNGIGGSTTIVKNGTGTATLNSRNDFSGGMSVNNGTLILNGNNSQVSGPIVVGANGILQLGNGTGANRDTFPNTNPALTVNGEFVQNETGREGIGTAITGTGSVRVESGRLEVTNGFNTYSGGTTINGGVFEVDEGSVPGTGTVTVNSGGEFQADGETHTLNNNFVLNDGVVNIGGGDASALTLAGQITVDSGATFGTVFVGANTGSDGLTITGNVVGAGNNNFNVNSGSNSTVNVSGNIGHSGTLNKFGDGTLALTGGSGSISSPFINVDAGDLDVTGAATGGLTLDPNQTLLGDATVTGNVTATSSSVVRVGFAGITEPTELLQNGDFQDVNAAITGNGDFRSFTPWMDENDFFQADQKGDTLQVALYGPEGNIAVRIKDGDPDSNFAFQETGHGWQTDETLTLSFNASEVRWQGGASTQSNSFQVLIQEVGGGAALWSTTIDLDGTHDGDPNDPGDWGVPQTFNFVIDVDDPNSGFTGGTPGTELRVALNAVAGEGINWVDNVSLITDSPTADPVDLQISGDLLLQAGSTLELDIHDTVGFDTLIVDGALTAGGTLDVNFTGVQPLDSGDSFDILDFDPNSISGSFASLDLPTLGAGLLWDTSNLLTTGVISVISDGLPGDFNNDGRVDGRDFLAWQRNPAIGSLSDWEANYGLPTTSNTSSVPEPSSLVLLGLAVAFGLTKRKR